MDDHKQAGATGAAADPRAEWAAVQRGDVSWYEWAAVRREGRPLVSGPPTLEKRVRAAVFTLAFLPGDFPSIQDTHTLMHPHTSYTRGDVMKAATWLLATVVSAQLEGLHPQRIAQVQTDLAEYLSFVCE